MTNCSLLKAVGRWLWRHRGWGTEFGRAGAPGVDAGMLESFSNGNSRFAEGTSIQFACNSCQLGEKFGIEEIPCAIHCRHLSDSNALG